MTIKPTLTIEELEARANEARAFAEVNGYNSLTGSDAWWLLEYADRLQAENERLRRELLGFICEECLKPLGR